MDIRKAREEDLEAVAAILAVTQDAHVEAYPERYVPISPENAVDSLRGRLGDGFWVAVENGAVTGYVVVEYIQTEGNRFLKPRKYGYLQQIGVAAASRRNGVGRQLVNHAIDQCAKQGIENIELDVWMFNGSAKQFLRPVGSHPMLRRCEYPAISDALNW